MRSWYIANLLLAPADASPTSLSASPFCRGSFPVVLVVHIHDFVNTVVMFRPIIAPSLSEWNLLIIGHFQNPSMSKIVFLIARSISSSLLVLTTTADRHLTVFPCGACFFATVRTMYLSPLLSCRRSVLIVPSCLFEDRPFLWGAGFPFARQHVGHDALCLSCVP